VVTDETSARLCLRSMVEYIGMGFHMEELAESYVTNADEPTFEKFECEFYNYNLTRVCEILGDEVPKIVMSVWCELGMLTDKELQKQEEEIMANEKFDYKAECDKLENLIHGFVNQKIDELGEACFTVSVTRDNCLNDSVGVRFLEEDGSHLVMDMLEDMANYLFTHSGRHYCITNNSPTDGSVLVFVDTVLDEVFDKYYFAQEFKDGFDEWLKDPQQFKNRPKQHIVYQTLDDTISRDCECNWKDAIKYNEEMWYQVMIFARNGISL
jgi:hypothetical protein